MGCAGTHDCHADAEAENIHNALDFLLRILEWDCTGTQLPKGSLAKTVLNTGNLASCKALGQ